MDSQLRKSYTGTKTPSWQLNNIICYQKWIPKILAPFQRDKRKVEHSSLPFIGHEVQSTPKEEPLKRF